jgi:hypothetical protein
VNVVVFGREEERETRDNKRGGNKIKEKREET